LKILQECFLMTDSVKFKWIVTVNVSQTKEYFVAPG